MTAYSDFYQEARTQNKNLGHKFFEVGKIESQITKALEKQGVVLLSLDIIQRGLDIAHTTRKYKGAKAIADEWLENLPEYLKKPNAVFLDKTKKEPVILYVFKHNGKKAKKIVVKINQRIKGRRIVNILRTGGILDNPQGLRGINYVLLDGEMFWNK